MDPHDGPPPEPPLSRLATLEHGLGPRRMRRYASMLYQTWLNELRGLESFRDLHHPDMPDQALAKQMLRKVADVAELNARLRERTKPGKAELDSDLAWITECGAWARRTLEPGDDGTAGVRESRRPRPTPGQAAAEVAIPTPQPVTNAVSTSRRPIRGHRWWPARRA